MQSLSTAESLDQVVTCEQCCHTVTLELSYWRLKIMACSIKLSYIILNNIVLFIVLILVCINILLFYTVVVDVGQIVHLLMESVR